MLSLAVAVLGESRARACSDWFATGEVLGVTPDGGWVYVQVFSGGGADAYRSEITRYAPDGSIAVAKRLCTGDDCVHVCGKPTEPGVPACVASDPLIELVGPGFVLPDDPLRSQDVRAQIRKHLQLAPLETKPGARAAQSDRICALITVDFEKTRVPVHALTENIIHECVKVKAARLVHPKAQFEFVRERWAYGQSCKTAVDQTIWYPKMRLTVLRDFVKAEKLAPRAQIAAYRKVVEAEPGFVLARAALYDALAASGVPWAEARATMNVPWPSELWPGHIMYFIDGRTNDVPEDWSGPDYEAWESALPPSPYR